MTPDFDPENFFENLQEQIAVHRALRHPFLQRFSQQSLTLEQLRTFAVQHYMYSRLFTRNMAAALANVPDEDARSLLILNLYEEIGEPFRMRERVHLLLLQEGLVRAEDVGEAFGTLAAGPGRGDIVQVLIERGLVQRQQVLDVVSRHTNEAKSLTHPAIFRRFLKALGVSAEIVERNEAIPETRHMIAEYQDVCRNGHWLEAMGAMGPGTECVVPALYTFIEEGLARSGFLAREDYLFWTIHIHCDDGHGANIIKAISPFARTREDQQRITRGAGRVLDARATWFDGLARLLGL